MLEQPKEYSPVFDALIGRIAAEGVSSLPATTFRKKDGTVLEGIIPYTFMVQSKPADHEGGKPNNTIVLAYLTASEQTDNPKDQVQLHFIHAGKLAGINVINGSAVNKAWSGIPLLEAFYFSPTKGQEQNPRRWMIANGERNVKFGEFSQGHPNEGNHFYFEGYDTQYFKFQDSATDTALIAPKHLRKFPENRIFGLTISDPKILMSNLAPFQRSPQATS